MYGRKWGLLSLSKRLDINSNTEEKITCMSFYISNIQHITLCQFPRNTWYPFVRVCFVVLTWGRDVSVYMHECTD